MTETYLHPERYAKSAALYKKALEFIPGGVNSTARAAFSYWVSGPRFWATVPLRLPKRSASVFMKTAPSSRWPPH
jgi:hypothetical protein